MSHLRPSVCICVNLWTSGQRHYNLVPNEKKNGAISCDSTKTDFRYEPVAELAVERSKNLDSFAMLTRSLKAISRRNRTSRLFLSSSSVGYAIFFTIKSNRMRLSCSLHVKETRKTRQEGVLKGIRIKLQALRTCAEKRDRNEGFCLVSKRQGCRFEYYEY